MDCSRQNSVSQSVGLFFFSKIPCDNKRIAQLEKFFEKETNLLESHEISTGLLFIQ